MSAPVPDDLAVSFQPVVGVAVMLRTLRPQDIDIESDFVRGLSPETRHNRLLGGAITITREYLERLTSVDYSRDMALAATLMLEKEVLIGVARYVRDAQGDAAEFAIVVSDSWHGRGIGKRLLARLAAIARQRGVRQLYGDVLAINRPMLGLVQKLGFALSRSPHDRALTRATLDLGSE
jgi:acetyltransferase